AGGVRPGGEAGERPATREPDPGNAGEGRSVPALDPKRLAVYVVASSAFAGRSHREVMASAIAGGATAAQLRAPELHDGALMPLAAEFAQQCRVAGVL